MTSGLSLSAQQRKAVESSSKALLILAGPGTGKTRVLIERIAHLIDEGCRPSRILAVTFSRKATHEMLERLEAKNPTVADQVEVSTLHAFCIDLVTRHGFRLGLGRRLKLMNSAQAFLFLREIAEKLPLDRLSKSAHIEPLIHDLLSFFQDCKDEGLWPEDVIAFAETLPSSTPDEEQIKNEWLALADIYNSFQNHCFEKGYLDFGDAILGAVRLLEEHAFVKQEVQSQLDAVLVDEFQDTNWTQIKLLQCICGPDTKITVVGDDDQAIYRFRGASFSAFRFFEELFSPIEVVELTETYRLPPAVSKVASALIQANGQERYRPDKSLESLSSLKNPVVVVQANDFVQEAKWVAEKIKLLLEESVPASEIAVLVRSHNHASLFCEEAGRQGIPFHSNAHESLFDHAIIQDLLSFLRLLIEPRDNIALLRLLDSVFIGLSANQIYAFCKANDFNSKRYLDFIEEIESSSLDPEIKIKLSAFMESFKELRKDSFREPGSQIILRFLEQTKAVQKLVESGDPSLKALANFLNHLSEWESVQEKRQIAELYPLLEAIASRETQLPSEENDSAIVDPEAIRVLSVHASKGLEFDHVFILSLVGRRFPSINRSATWMLPDAARKEKAPTKESHVLEERRLLYVAATRAKKNLYLTGVEKKNTKLSKFIEVDIPAHLNDETALVKNKLALPDESDQLLTQCSSSFERVSALIKAPLENKALKLSFTQIDNYETCPQRYWFAFELRIPSPPSPSLTIGSAVHEALERFYNEVIQDKSPQKEELLQHLERAFEREQEKYPVCSERDLKTAQIALEEFFDSQASFEKPIAVEAAFKIRVGEHQVSGKIDRVDAVDGGVRIIDYKTGKSKSPEKKEDQKFARESLQFSIYALAAQEQFDWKVKELSFHYIYDNTFLNTTRSDEDLQKTKEKILSIAERIQAQEFSATPGHHCRQCGFVKLCPSAQT